MMEKGSEEWEILDYYPCLGDEETVKSKLGRVIDTGVSVGTKLVITGIVISSVPLVLPPLVVISALGFAFSVPFGVVFASYACTQKLMSKLLPSPPLSGMLDDQTETVGPQQDDQQPLVVTEKEEREQNHAFKDGIEMRIELVDNEYDAGRGDDIGDEQARNKLDNSFQNTVEVGGLNKEEKDQHSLERGEDEKPSLNDNTVVALELTNTGDRKREGENKEEDESLNVQVQTDNLMENKGENTAMNRKGGDNNEKVETTITEIEKAERAKKRETVSKGKSSSKEIERRGKKKTSAALRFPGKRKETEVDKAHAKPQGTKTSSENNVEIQLGVGEKFAIEETSTDELGSVPSEKKQAGEKECIIFDSEDYDNKQILLNDDVGIIDCSVEKEDKHPGFKDGAATKTAEGESANDRGVDKEIEQSTTIVHGDPGETHYDSSMIADDGDYSLEVAASTGMPELKHDEKMRQSKEEKDASVVHSGLHSDEELFRDEKIWEKIDAIRAIVGFEAPRQPSYFEEVKALYLFTGIEPPSTTTDPCDFAEFYNRLCFLMSVIGLR